MPPRRTSSSKPRICVFTKARGIAFPSRAHRPRDSEPSVVAVPAEVSGLVFGPAHLDDPQPSLCGEVRDEMHAEVDDAVREEVLVPSALEDVPGDEPIGTLRDEEARDAEIPQPLEQSVHLAPTVLELRQDLERLERVDHDQVESPLFFDRSDRSLEAREPVGLLAKEVLRGPRVKDDERTFRDLEWEAQAAHLLEQARCAFLQAQIEAVEFLLHGILDDDRESKGRFHRAGGALDEDDVAAGDPAFQT